MEDKTGDDGMPSDPLSESLDLKTVFSKPPTPSKPTARRSFTELPAEEQALPEIQRLHGLFESLESEMLGLQATRVVESDSDGESDDGIHKEERKLPNASIHDMHTIVPSLTGSRLMVAPVEDGGTAEQSSQSAATEASLEAPNPLSPAPATIPAPTVTATPARVTFDPSVVSKDPSEDNTPTRMPSSPSGQMPPSSGTKHGHHGFTPMTLQQLMKMETPESRVDEMLQELYNLMGVYNSSGKEGAEDTAGDYGSSSNLRDLDPELGDVLFGSPLPRPASNLSASTMSDSSLGASARPAISADGGNGPGSAAVSMDEEMVAAFFDPNIHLAGEEVALASPASPASAAPADRSPPPVSPLPLSQSSSTGALSHSATAKVHLEKSLVDPLSVAAPGPTLVAPLSTASPARVVSTTAPAPAAPAPAPAAAESAAVERPRLRSSSVDIDSDIADIIQMSSHRKNSSGGSSAANSPMKRAAGGWVDVEGKPGATSPGPAGMQLHQSIAHGDFYIWSEGPKLTAEYINSAYVGMNRSAVTHNNDNGVLVPATLAPSGVIPGTTIPKGALGQKGAGGSGAASAPPDSPTSAAAAVSAAGASSGGAGGAGAQRTMGTSSHGYYVVHLLECVVRPDVELRHLLATVLKVARTRDCKCYFPHNNHVVLKAQSHAPVPSAPAATGNQRAHHHGSSAGSAGAGVPPAADLREWDQIDVQVVLSQEVRQRMLVCQFLRRVPSLASSGYGNLNLIIYQIAGGAALMSLTSSPKTKSFVSKLKRELTENSLCLSSLYNAPADSVCAVPQQPDGLDPHFRAQLQQQVYGHMWERLEGDIRLMSEHLQAQLKECHDFVSTLEPMYRAYGLPAPLPWSSSSQRHHIQQSFPSPAPPHLRSGGTGPASAQQPYTPVRAPMSLTAETSSGLTPGNASTPERSPAPAAAAAPLGSPSPRSPRKGGAQHEDGMAVVLRTVHQCLQDLQDSCDEDYARRVQLQNEWVVRQVDSMQDYKHSLLFTLASNPDAPEANIMKTFNAQFWDVPTTIDAQGNVSYRSGSAPPSQPGSRNNSTDRTALDNKSGAGAGVEASLYSEFQDSPAPKSSAGEHMSTVSLHSGGKSAAPVHRKPDGSPSQVTHQAPAPAPAASGWMTGLTNAFASFTSSYAGTAAATPPPGPTTIRTHPQQQQGRAQATDAAFKPKELRPKLTQEEVSRRLDSYQQRTPVKGQQGTAAGAAAADQRAEDGETADGEFEEGDFTVLSPASAAESLIALTPAVLYYCSCLISKSPGTIYITPTAICVTSSSGLLTMRQNKEVFPLSALHDVRLPSQWAAAGPGSAVPVLLSNTLQLVFFKAPAGHSQAGPTSPLTAHAAGPAGAGGPAVPGSREMLISPMMLDCAKLRHILLEVKAAFAQVR